jgi:hypothetical protein
VRNFIASASRSRTKSNLRSPPLPPATPSSRPPRRRHVSEVPNPQPAAQAPFTVDTGDPARRHRRREPHHRAPAGAATVIDTTPLWQRFSGHVPAAPDPDRTLNTFTSSCATPSSAPPSCSAARSTPGTAQGRRPQAVGEPTAATDARRPVHRLLRPRHLRHRRRPARRPNAVRPLRQRLQGLREAHRPGLRLWGILFTDGYRAGQFVCLNNGTDESQWTTVPWSPLPDGPTWDLPFTASFQQPPVSPCRRRHT